MLLAVQLLGSVTAGGIAACILAGTGYSGDALVVTINEFMFKPPQVIVPIGTRIVWKNNDDAPHTIVATDGGFRSGALDTGDRFSLTFNQAGTFEYFCSLHPQMKGEIVVVR